MSATNSRNTRYQVTENRHGYAVKDQATGSVISQTYVRRGNAINRAIRENEASAQLRLSRPFIKF
jgi:hypothetical protein